MPEEGVESALDPRETPREPANPREAASADRHAREDSRATEASLARAVEFAASAGQWEIVADLSRQLAAMRQRDEGVPLRLVRGAKK